MRTILALLLLSPKVLSLSAPEEIHARWIKIATPYYSFCMCATGADQIKAKNLVDKLELVQDPCVKCYGACLMIKTEMMTSDGIIIPEAWEEIGGVPLEFAKKCANNSSSVLDKCEKTYFGYCLLALL